MASVSVLGAGSWGTALAHLIASNGFEVSLWDVNPRRISELASTHSNERYLPGFALSPKIQFESDLGRAIKAKDLILIAVPSHAFAACLTRLRPYLLPSPQIAWGTKGLDPESGGLLHEVALATLGADCRLAVLSGPTFAREVMQGLPSALTVASYETEFAVAVAGLLHNAFFRAYTSSDMIGVQLGGAVKNVLAIAAGVSDGMGFGANARAALITRGLAEMIRLGEVMGAKRETFMGLAGVGDLILTATDDQSRNRRLGLGLGRGKTVAELRAEIGQEIEGILTAKLIWQLARKLKVEMPIVEQVHALLYQGVAPEEAVHRLLVRERKPETL
ncbi:MAG: NAD(P)-dependent glycerol-3-phosphate dehydrogenase [Methylohalobius sp.]|nr:NAD(P)-dependent glycerol-3-phosphate dehydrogenase [Methylohalobius sp.]